MSTNETKPETSPATDRAVVLYSVCVTEEDIQHGIGRDCNRCAVSLGLDRALPSGVLSYVNPYGGMLTNPDTIGIFVYRKYEFCFDNGVECPQGIEDFAHDFDEWSDYQMIDSNEELAEWNEDRCREFDYMPYKPEPFEFKIALPKI